MSVPSLGSDFPDIDLFARLLKTWKQKQKRNLERTVYYEGKNALRDFGIAVPPQMQRAYTPLQWISKGIHAHTDRSVFEGFVNASGSEDPFELTELLDDNDFITEFDMAKTSSAIHACSFLTVTRGRVDEGEPEVLILPRSADSSAALWNTRKRSLEGFLSVVDVQDGVPTEMVMYTPERIYQFDRTTTGWEWRWERHGLDEVPVARVVYKPELNRPFGHSRITRTAMGLTDAAVRTVLRSEVSAEFYSADKYWLFGADVTKFVGSDKWSAVMGRMNALDVDNPEDMPEVHRFSGSTPQPHIDQLRMLASLFADDQSLDVKWADASNPASADAIYAAKEELIMDVRNANRMWGRGAVKAIQFAVRMRDRLDRVPPELRTLSANFVDPAIVSPSARSNAFVQLASQIPGFAETRVGLEYAGLSSEQVLRFMAERRRGGVVSLVNALRQGGGVEDEEAAAVAAQRTPAEA
ncbi:MAG: phage portal protein [Microcella pacifica]